MSDILEVVDNFNAMSVKDPSDGEANLMMDLVRAKHDIFQAQKALTDSILQEHEVLSSLLRFQAETAGKRLDDVDLGLGYMRVVFKKHGWTHHPQALLSGQGCLHADNLENALHHDTLIRYLLNELSTYENDHSDTLCPTQREADASLLGEHLLVKPVCIQDLQSMQECISADVAGLWSDLCTLAATLCKGQLTHAPESPSHTNMCDLDTLYSPTLPSHPGNSCTTYPRLSPPKELFLALPCPAVPSSILPQPSTLTRMANSLTTGSRLLPEKGLIIPDIVKHWADGDPEHGLLIPLQDWLPEWIHGKNKNFFAMKYHQCSVIALEFLNRFDGHEPAFLATYPEATEGHTALLCTINCVKRERGDIIPRKCDHANDL
ncbi:uncharacterized protein EDB91DRAFT_1251666 [Suillus paluster]|uniref:uncharacterized protein n=1 Tax=Suillus paluster TaxID=48578 RepID=UPI001B864D35|nr:uncharacterized protein EDB91DRAFT_1251666 [Suillus paluster]KAG1732617.1 hypothetical protein EDB91DRAFT_1251666 [Suillus paluster]